ncbi:MAG: serpin family protein [Dehalococcoidales bacterium]|nr:MAG: serpin family protein [Dehalococcoidales bacterium]
MKKEVISILILLSLVLPLTGCTGTVSAGLVESDKERIESPDVSSTDKDTLVEGNTSFAFDLFQTLRNENGNVFYSPHSISLALAMTYAGARGETAQQMADTLHYDLSQDKLHPAFNYLDIELDKRGEGAQGKDDEGFRLNIVNAIWGQRDFTFLPEFLDTLAENYGAGLRVLDFINETEKSRITINDWVSDETEGRIEDLIPQGQLNAATRLVLTNAIYFNAAWQHQFEERLTSDAPFYLLNGQEVTVPMMRQTESFGHTSGDGYQAIELRYDGGELSMVILLADTGQYDSFEEQLTARKANEIINDMGYTQVELAMPKFEFESEFQMKDTLSTMGMPIAFSSGADFSGMTGGKDLYIDQVIHKAFVSVDESGTEAAAATAVDMKLTSAPAEPVKVTVDRPFIFFIRDIETGTILFIGRVLNPVDKN